MSFQGLFSELKDASLAVRARRIRDRLVSVTDDELLSSSWAEASEAVLPILRPLMTVQSEYLGKGLRLDLPRRVVTPFISELIALDLPFSMRYVELADVERWHVGTLELRRRAIANLLAKGMRGALLDDLVGTMLVSVPAGYAASWLVVPTVFRQLASTMGGEVVALAPHQESVCFVRSDDPDALSAVMSWAHEEYEGSSRRLSPVPYCQDATNQLREWVPPEGHPCGREIERARRELAITAYEEQREFLEGIADAQHENVFIAKLVLFEYPNGRVVTRTSWPKNVENGLLPLADEIFLAGSDGKEVIVMGWAEAMEVAAAWIQPVTGVEPTRVRIVGWPGEELPRLRERAIGLFPKRPGSEAD
jgi:hypothetical protein